MAQSSDRDSMKCEPVVSPEEVQRLIDMGLGRGVDATSRSLWKQKSAFQVQSVASSLKNIIGTDEGSAHQYYEREVSSIIGRQTQIKGSIDEPHTTINVGMDTLQSQTLNKSRKSVGEQVITRTISFCSSFDNLPLQHIGGKGSERSEVRSTDEASLTLQSVSISTDFEERLSDWLLDRISGRGHDVFEEAMAGVKVDSSTAKLANYLEKKADDEAVVKKVDDDCLMFLKHVGVTHYISSIRLGALKFRILTSTEYSKKVRVKGSMGVGGVAKASLSHSSLTHRHNSSLRVKEIGRIVGGSVRMRTSEEAVIGFQLRPIHSLVRSYHIQESLKRALRDYIVHKILKSKGPYLISCGNEKLRLYWKIGDNNTVKATPDVEDASIFFLISTGDQRYPHEFMICYHGEDEDALTRPRGILDPKSKEEDLAPLPLYLNGTASLFGYNAGPLEVKPNVTEENTRFILHNRVHSRYESIDFNSWMLGDEYFINCSRRRFKWDGYLSVKKTKLVLDYSTAIVPTQDYHNGLDTWMLFRLMPVEYRHRKRHLVSRAESV